jgi:hypothetical protein
VFPTYFKTGSFDVQVLQVQSIILSEHKMDRVLNHLLPDLPPLALKQNIIDLVADELLSYFEPIKTS